MPWMIQIPNTSISSWLISRTHLTVTRTYANNGIADTAVDKNLSTYQE
jgi:hypothetical protein